MRDEQPTVGRAWELAAERLRRAGVPDARAESGWLLARLLGTDRGGLLVRRGEPLPGVEAESYRRWIARRERREPAQHIVGTQEFYGLELEVDGRALIPRPETELVVDAALALDLPPEARAADLGTGSGCLAVTLAVRRPGLRVLALDRSEAALDLARANARRHGVASRVHAVRAGFSVPPPPAWAGATSLVVSNPPYVSEADWSELEPEVRDHDPREALVPGPTGLEAFPDVLRLAAGLAHAGAHLLLEIGHGQAASVERLLPPAGWTLVETRPDLRGIPRVVVARRSDDGP